MTKSTDLTAALANLSSLLGNAAEDIKEVEAKPKPTRKPRKPKAPESSGSVPVAPEPSVEPESNAATPPPVPKVRKPRVTKTKPVVEPVATVTETASVSNTEPVNTTTTETTVPAKPKAPRKPRKKLGDVSPDPASLVNPVNGKPDNVGDNVSTTETNLTPEQLKEAAEADRIAQIQQQRDNVKANAEQVRTFTENRRRLASERRDSAAENPAMGINPYGVQLPAHQVFNNTDVGEEERNKESKELSEEEKKFQKENIKQLSELSASIKKLSGTFKEMGDPNSNFNKRLDPKNNTIGGSIKEWGMGKINGIKNLFTKEGMADFALSKTDPGSLMNVILSGQKEKFAAKRVEKKKEIDWITGVKTGTEYGRELTANLGEKDADVRLKIQYDEKVKLEAKRKALISKQEALKKTGVAGANLNEAEQGELEETSNTLSNKYFTNTMSEADIKIAEKVSIKKKVKNILSPTQYVEQKRAEDEAAETDAKKKSLTKKIEKGLRQKAEEQIGGMTDLSEDDKVNALKAALEEIVKAIEEISKENIEVLEKILAKLEEDESGDKENDTIKPASTDDIEKPETGESIKPDEMLTSKTESTKEPKIDSTDVAKPDSAATVTPSKESKLDSPVVKVLKDIKNTLIALLKPNSNIDSEENDAEKSSGKDKSRDTKDKPEEKKKDEKGGIFSTLMDLLGSFKDLKGIIKGLGTAIASAFGVLKSGLMGFGGKAVGATKNLFSGGAKSISNVAGNAPGKVGMLARGGALLSGAYSTIATKGSSLLSTVAEKSGSLYNSTMSAGKGALSTVASKGGSLLSSGKDLVIKALDSGKGLLSGALETGKGALSTVASKGGSLLSSGGKMLSGALDAGKGLFSGGAGGLLKGAAKLGKGLFSGGAGGLLKGAAKLGKGLGPIGALLGSATLLSDFSDSNQAVKEGKMTENEANQKKGGSVGGIAGGLLGGAAGALLGPAGAIAGGIAGNYIGEYGGEKLVKGYQGIKSFFSGDKSSNAITPTKVSTAQSIAPPQVAKTETPNRTLLSDKLHNVNAEVDDLKQIKGLSSPNKTPPIVNAPTTVNNNNSTIIRPQIRNTEPTLMRTLEKNFI